MNKEYRTMKRGDVYEIEEKLGDGDWVSVMELESIDAVKNMLKTLKTLDQEDKSK